MTKNEIQSLQGKNLGLVKTWMTKKFNTELAWQKTWIGKNGDEKMKY